ncbi:hypothetical protein BY996DRAFT_6599985 [Phakopsora pachyrhizi]|nr:hypothetical protein BY996DRAFT_6599985 [Phakopsora pachyrhizi]
MTKDYQEESLVEVQQVHQWFYGFYQALWDFTEAFTISDEEGYEKTEEEYRELESNEQNKCVEGEFLGVGRFWEATVWWFRNKEKELKRFKHQSQKLDMAQAKIIIKKHPQSRK